jgi:hypothetical protein
VRRPAVLLTAVAVVAGVVPATVALAERDNSHRPAIYLVGGAAESINPTDDMLFKQGDFNLGGFGFGSGKIGNVAGVPGVTDVFAGRTATGILADGVHSRAFAVSDGAHTMVLGQIETQGYFNAYKQGPFGINEIRQDASAQIAAAAAEAAAATGHGHGHGHGKSEQSAAVPTPSQILVDSDHSHGGPDTAGVWGGVPTSYLKLIHDQTVKAIVEAWKSMRPATLSYGVAHAGVNGEANYPPQECIDAGTCDKATNPDWILTNDFADDPANQTMDDEVRVLQARDPDTGAVLDTYTNFSAHPTVLGAGNRLVTGDYPGRLSLMLARTYGGFGMDQVATLGRTHSNHGACNAAEFPGEDDATCQLDTFSARVLRKVKEALSTATPFTGKPVVAMNSYLLTDPTTSGVLSGALYAGQVIGAPAGRAANAPWYTGNLLGTSVFSGRIGTVLVNGGPGEMYPQIVQKVRDLVLADNPDGIKGVMNVGTAGDFLGYIIAPLEAYTCPAAAAMVDGGCNQDSNPDPTRISPDPIGSDNYFFNISHTFGERLTCDLLRGAGDVLLGDGAHYWQQYERCPLFANDFALPEGQDTQFPQQPDLYDSAHPAFDHM